MDITFEIVIKIFWAVVVVLGFALLFNTPKRALWVAALLGALGFGLKTLLIHTVIEGQLVLASLAGASLVGILGVYFAHRVHTPPIIFTIPAVINMIPGKLGYEFVIGILKLVTAGKNQDVDFQFFLQVMNAGLSACFILLALTSGIIFPILFLNTKSVKNKDLNKIMKNELIRKPQIARYKRAKRKL